MRRFNRCQLVSADHYNMIHQKCQRPLTKTNKDYIFVLYWTSGKAVQK